MTRNRTDGNRTGLPILLAAFLALCSAIGLSLGGCARATPSWGPDTPRNGAGQPVDPVYGIPIPGYPDISVP